MLVIEHVAIRLDGIDRAVIAGEDLLEVPAIADLHGVDRPCPGAVVGAVMAVEQHVASALDRIDVGCKRLDGRKCQRRGRKRESHRLHLSHPVSVACLKENGTAAPCRRPVCGPRAPGEEGWFSAHVGG